MIWYNQTKSGQLDLLYFLLEDSFATRTSRFLSSVWREFTRVRWIGGDNALIVQTRKILPSIEAGDCDTTFHWSTIRSSGKFLDVWTIRALSPPIHRTLVNSRQTELRKRLRRVAKLSSSKKYSKSSWPDLVWLYHIYITWMNQNLHQPIWMITIH